MLLLVLSLYWCDWYGNDVAALSIMSGAMTAARATVLASALLHTLILKNVLRSPMSFFDMTPIGRIVNRFSKDLDTVDVLLPNNLRAWIACLISVRRPCHTNAQQTVQYCVFFCCCCRVVSECQCLAFHEGFNCGASKSSLS